MPGTELDGAAWGSLAGAHRHLAHGDDLARRYPADVSPIAALPPGAGPESWDALRALVPADDRIVLFGALAFDAPVPAGWRLTADFTGIRLVAGDDVAGLPASDALTLGEADVPEMLDLVERTRPGPFGPGTHRLGRYRGLRTDERLTSMAGERLHPPGATEISAVCTDPLARGGGAAGRLIADVVHAVRARGETPFLHVSGDNVGAWRLYERLGFTVDRRSRFTVLTPG